MQLSWSVGRQGFTLIERGAYSVVLRIYNQTHHTPQDNAECRIQLSCMVPFTIGPLVGDDRRMGVYDWLTQTP